MSWLMLLIAVLVGFVLFKFLVKPFFKILGLAVLALVVYFFFFH